MVDETWGGIVIRVQLTWDGLLDTIATCRLVPANGRDALLEVTQMNEFNPAGSLETSGI